VGKGEGGRGGEKKGMAQKRGVHVVRALGAAPKKSISLRGKKKRFERKLSDSKGREGENLTNEARGTVQAQAAKSRRVRRAAKGKGKAKRG